MNSRCAKRKENKCSVRKTKRKELKLFGKED